MDYIKIRFGDETDLFDDELGKSLEEMFRPANPFFSMSEQAWKPPMDVFETSGEMVIYVELAGVDKKSLGIEFRANSVKIHGRRYDSPRNEKGRYHLAEIQSGRFSRTLHFPSQIDTSKVSWEYMDGILILRIPKTKRAKKHHIPISTDG